MRQWTLFFFTLTFLVAGASSSVHAQQCGGVGGSYVCPSGSTTPPTSSSSGEGAGGVSAAAPPIGSGEPVDYTQTMTSQYAPHVQPNFNEEATLFQPGQCIQKIIPANSAIALPFVYDGKANAMNVAAGSGAARLFISNMVGYDPQGKQPFGLQTDFQSPCHAQANLPQECKNGVCTPHPYNQNSLSLMDVQTVADDAGAHYKSCPLTPGETYYLNVQNHSIAPVCVSIGNNAACGGC